MPACEAGPAPPRAGSGGDGNAPVDECSEPTSTATNRGSEEQSDERSGGDAPCWWCAHGGGRERCSLSEEPPLSPVLGVSSRWWWHGCACHDTERGREPERERCHAVLPVSMSAWRPPASLAASVARAQRGKLPLQSSLRPPPRGGDRRCRVLLLLPRVLPHGMAVDDERGRPRRRRLLRGRRGGARRRRGFCLRERRHKGSKPTSAAARRHRIWRVWCRRLLPPRGAPAAAAPTEHAVKGHGRSGERRLCRVGRCSRAIQARGRVRLQGVAEHLRSTAVAPAAQVQCTNEVWRQITHGCRHDGQQRAGCYRDPGAAASTVAAAAAAAAGCVGHRGRAAEMRREARG